MENIKKIIYMENNTELSDMVKKRLANISKEKLELITQVQKIVFKSFSENSYNKKKQLFDSIQITTEDMYINYDYKWFE
jgi:hypothetical protein